MSRIANLHAHVYTPAGASAGEIDRIMDWSLDDLYDGAGKYRFNCWAKKANYDLIVPGYRVDVYGTFGSNEILLSSGAVDTPEPDINKLGGSTFTVAGMGRIGELNDRIIVALNIISQAWTYIGADGAVRWIDSAGLDAERDLTQAYDGNPATYTTPTFKLGDHWWLYLGYKSPFMAAKYTFQSVNGELSGDHEQYQHFTAANGWSNYTNFVDGTKIGTNILAQDGTMTWDRPTDWVRNTPTASSGRWYWQRIRTDSDESGSTVGDISIKEIEIYADQPTLAALNLIMAYAPSGWKTSGYPDTPASAYGAITDMSVLQSLRWLRDQVGGHFKASLSGGSMQIDWYTEFSDSLYIADGLA